MLLEIFDCYRRRFEYVPERTWNGRNGRFNLAHVCQKRRCIVLASPSRLQLQLFFTVDTPTRATTAVLRGLPFLPIVTDYTIDAWTSSMHSLMVSVVRHSERVYRIACHELDVDLTKSFATMSHPFPALESLEINEICGPDTQTLDFPAALRCSTDRLRRLEFWGTPASFWSQLLSSATGPPYLFVTIYPVFSSSPSPLLPIHLKSMRFLRFLGLQMFPPFAPGITRPAPPI